MGLNAYSKRRIKRFEKQGIKRNEKNILALRRQQKECWDGDLHSGSSYYFLHNFVKKPYKRLFSKN